MIKIRVAVLPIIRKGGSAVGLNFVGETGVYLPTQDAIKFVAVDGARAIDCIVNRSALDAIGCGRGLETADMIRQFEKHRIEIEVAAMIKYRKNRRMFTPMLVIDIEADDLREVAPTTLLNASDVSR